MNKTVSISLSGQVFQVDELAYETLKAYLENIRRRFASTEGGQEIIADIESRIAELFLEKLNDRKQVITPADVEAMMQAMGKPEDFEAATGQSESQSAGAQPEGTRRFFRNPDEKVLGGVCSGLSAYFGINDPVWMRLLFIILFFTTAGFLIYLILWIIIPEAKTASEKLQMRGEYVNISNIEKSIRDEMNDLGKRINNINTGKAKGALQQFVDFCIQVILWGVKAIGKILGVALIIAGLAIIVGITVGVFVPSEMISVESLYPAIFPTQTQFLIVALGFSLVVLAPAAGILFAGFQLLLNSKRRIKGVGLTLFALWLVGLALMSVFIVRVAVDFNQTETVRREIPLEQPAQDTLTLEGISRKIDGDAGFYNLPEVGEFTETDSELIFTDLVNLDIRKSATGKFELVQTNQANGRQSLLAQKRAENISYELKQNGNKLTFSEYFSVPKKDHYRAQEVSLVLKVPEGKAVYLDESLAGILYDVENVHGMYDRDMVGHTWVMLPAGLTCTDCTPEELSRRESPRHEFKRVHKFELSYED